MEKKRGTTIIVVAALIIAVVSLGVALAAFSTTLTINGSATVNASNWNIFFTTSATGSDPGTSGTPLPSGQIVTSNIQTGIPSTVSDASATVKTADFTWTAKFMTPGDKVVFDFYVRNTGDYNAQISSINTPQVSCTAQGGNEGEETTVCGHIHYNVYTDSEGTTPLDTTGTVASKGNAHYYVIAYLDNTNWAPDGSDLPPVPVTVDFDQISIIYQQAN